jgi:preprotein translocase subunit YajC
VNITGWVGLVVVVMALGVAYDLLVRPWQKRRREESQCFHHNIDTGESWIIKGGIIDYRKLWQCSECRKVWVL